MLRPLYPIITSQLRSIYEKIIYYWYYFLTYVYWRKLHSRDSVNIDENHLRSCPAANSRLKFESKLDENKSNLDIETKTYYQ